MYTNQDNQDNYEVARILGSNGWSASKINSVLRSPILPINTLEEWLARNFPQPPPGPFPRIDTEPFILRDATPFMLRYLAVEALSRSPGWNQSRIDAVLIDNPLRISLDPPVVPNLSTLVPPTPRANLPSLYLNPNQSDILPPPPPSRKNKRNLWILFLAVTILTLVILNFFGIGGWIAWIVAILVGITCSLWL